MANLITNLTHGQATDSSSENLGDQTTASISPSAGTLVLVAVGSNKPSTVPNEPTVSGLSMTWTLIGTVLGNSNQLRMTLFRGVANGNSGTLTISHGGQNQQNIYWGISQVASADTGGTNGSNAIVQSATGNGNEVTTFLVTLSSFQKVTNATFGAVYHNTNQDTSPGSGFTEVGEADGAHQLQSEFKEANDTSVDWSVAGNAKYVAIAVELKILLSGGAGVIPVFL